MRHPRGEHEDGGTRPKDDRGRVADQPLSRLEAGLGVVVADARRLCDRRPSRRFYAGARPGGPVRARRRSGVSALAGKTRDPQSLAAALGPEGLAHAHAQQHAEHPSRANARVAGRRRNGPGLCDRRERSHDGVRSCAAGLLGRWKDRLLRSRDEVDEGQVSLPLDYGSLEGDGPARLPLRLLSLREPPTHPGRRQRPAAGGETEKGHSHDPAAG